MRSPRLRRSATALAVIAAMLPGLLLAQGSADAALDAAAESPRTADQSEPPAASADDTEATGAPQFVDARTYVGWRVFDAYCTGCHGTDGNGTQLAPDLAPRIRRLTPTRFRTLLEDGYMGESDQQTPWGEIAEVRRYAAELWIYLEARANGELPPGPLQPIR